MTVKIFENSAVVAKAFVEAGAAGMTEGNEITFASGIKSPGCYIDCRKLLAHPRLWRLIMDELNLGFSADVMKQRSIQSVASVEAGGIPHASVFGRWRARTTG